MSKCPEASKHTLTPEGYIAWHSWAHDAGKHHRQIRCHGCGLYKIWVSKVPGTKMRLPKIGPVCLTEVLPLGWGATEK